MSTSTKLKNLNQRKTDTIWTCFSHSHSHTAMWTDAMGMGRLSMQWGDERTEPLGRFCMCQSRALFGKEGYHAGKETKKRERKKRERPTNRSRLPSKEKEPAGNV